MMVTSSLLSMQLVVVAYKEVMEVLVRCWSDGDVVVRSCLQELLDLYYLFDGFMDYFWKILLVSANGMNAKSLLYRSPFPDDDKKLLGGCP
ncbi:hypothetical protein Tco_0678361 [Tanacetum coccineum]|uniref:Uncharacterized protein n=1 Tax=Tanacetum coccineum TaxID=301880 RepID=A0ABQ4XEU2_9ASTR